MSKEITYQVPTEQSATEITDRSKVYEMGHYRETRPERVQVTADSLLGGARQAVQEAHGPQFVQTPEVVDLRPPQEQALEWTGKVMSARLESTDLRAA